MELRRLSILLAFFVVTFIAQCSECRHSAKRRDIGEINYDADVLADEASDDEAQNDGEGNDADEEVEDGVILTEPMNYSVPIGRGLRLECRTASSSPVVIQWTKEGSKYFLGTLKSTEQELKTYGVEDRIVIGANSTDLLIREVKPSDMGVYTCEILQTQKVSIQHRVTVLESPKIISLTASDNGEVVEGSDVLLTCEVSGSPPPQIIWSREEGDGNKRLQEKDGEFSGNRVLMRNVNRRQSGKYYCYALNSVGHNQAEVLVVIKGKPRVHVHRTIVNSAINVEAILQCVVREEPASYIRWYKDGQPIEDSSRQYSISTRGQHSNLTVTPTTDQDFGTFTCEAVNDQGTHNRSIDLVQSPVVENVQVDGPKLSWTVHSHQSLEEIAIQLRDVETDNPEKEWKIINVELPGGNRHEYDFVYSLEGENLESGKYEAYIKVKNDKSWNTPMEPMLVNIEVEPERIQHASVYAGNAHFVKPTCYTITTTLIYLLVRMI